MIETCYVSYQPNAKYLANLVDELSKCNLKAILPKEIVTIDKRELNINAFDQLKKRSPQNPYVLKLKREILLTEAEQIKTSNILLVFNPLGIKSGHITSQQLIALTIAWQNNIPRYLLESPDPMNEYFEEVLSMEPIILKGDIRKIQTKQKWVEAINKLVERKPEVQKEPEKLNFRFKLQRRDDN
jgi:hypothetical protein